MVLLTAHRVSRLSFASASVLLLLPVILTVRALLTGAVYGPLDLAYTSEPLASLAERAGAPPVANPGISDVYAEFFPWHDALRRAVRARQWPLWNPYALCGTPLAGAAQVAPYHPITITALLLPLPSSFAYAAAMLYLIAAVSAFLLAREYCESEIGPLFAAAAWMASTFLIFYAGTALANAMSIAPLVLLGGRRIVIHPGRASSMLLMAALVLLVLSGHPETLLHVVFFGICYVVFEAMISRPQSVPRVLMSGLAAGVGALLVCAMFLLPHIEVLLSSTEYANRASSYTQEAQSWSRVLHVVRASFFPFLEGAPNIEEPPHDEAMRHVWLPAAYAGSMVFAPALFALRRGRSRSRWFFAAATLLGLAAGAGASGLVNVFNLLPGFNLAINDRMIAFAALGLAVLAAIGIDVLDRRMALAFALVSIAMVAAALMPNEVSIDYLRIATFRAVVPVLLAASAVLMLPSRAAATTLLALLLMQRAGETNGLQPTMPAAAFYPSFPGREVMRADEPFRIVGTGALLPPEISTHYGLEDVRGFEAVTLDRFDALFPLWSKHQPVWSNRVDDLRVPLLSMMNVRFALTSPGSTLPDGWIVRARTPAYSVVENLRALPRAYVPRNITTVAREHALLRLAAIDDFAEKSIIEGNVTGSTVKNGPGSLSMSANNGRMIVRAHMEAAGWVIISSAAWPGWRAKLDGNRVTTRYANLAFIGVFVPAGDHKIELKYRPRSFVVGAAVSLIAIVAVIAMCIRRPA